MEGHKLFVAGKFVGKEGKDTQKAMWEKLVHMLNSLPGGAEKSAKQWQVVWRDVKFKASGHGSTLREKRNGTGNFPVDEPPLSPLEQRVIGIMGLSYVQGNEECPDSTPEEESLQLMLEQGNNTVLQLGPETSSLAEYPGLKHLSHNLYTAEEEREDCMEVLFETEYLNPQAEKGYSDPSPCPPSVADEYGNSNSELRIVTEPMGSQVPQVTSKLRSNAVKVNRPSPLNRTASGTSRRRPQRIGVQLEETRAHFAEISEKHASAMMMIGEAYKKFAEASLMHAQAALRQAENESRRVDVMEKIGVLLDRFFDNEDSVE